MSQPGTRKRPAPGASPYPQDLSQSAAYNTRSTRLGASRNSQRFQSQSPTSGSVPLDPSIAYPTSNPANMVPQAMMQETSNQLARRPMNQSMVMRNGYQNGSNDGWLATPQQPQDSNWTASPEDDRIEQEAVQAMDNARKSRKAIPPFVQKLRSFLEDSKNFNLIRWSKEGDSFIVEDEEEFAKTLIPELFKHANYASFVRQLNMYGFHKKVGLSDNSMRASEKKNKSPSEYANTYFRRDKPDWMWLISKPKTTAGKGKGSRTKQGEGNMEDEDELLDGELPVPPAPATNDGSAGIRGPRQPLMIGQGDQSVSNEQLVSVHQELRTIRHQHQMISSVIQKLRREHEQQAQQFQELHNRHENSINAILTFLATVYTRSLQGDESQNLGNLGNLFGGSMPHELSQSGTVVDVGDLNVPGLDAQNGQIRRSPRRQPLLLKAPPASDVQTIHTLSAASTPAADTPAMQAETPSASGPVSGTPGMDDLQSAPPMSAGATNQPYNMNGSGGTNAGTPDGDILSLINSHNAKDATNTGYGARMSFPQALSHLQTADGKSPLTNNERNGMLQRIANESGMPGTSNGNNALMNPDQPGLAGNGGNGQWGQTADDFAFLERTLKEQDDKMSSVSNVLRPLSPSGSIPGLNDGNGGYVPPPQGLDFDQIFNSGDYFGDANNGTGGAGGNGEAMFGDAGNNGFGSNDEFGFGEPGAGADDAGNGFNFVDGDDDGPLVETVNNSEATSPANTVEDVGTPDEAQSPRKRRRRN